MDMWWTWLAGIRVLFRCVMIDELAGIDDPYGSYGQIVVDLFVYLYFFKRVSESTSRTSRSSTQKQP